MKLLGKHHKIETREFRKVLSRPISYVPTSITNNCMASASDNLCALV